MSKCECEIMCPICDYVRDKKIYKCPSCNQVGTYSLEKMNRISESVDEWVNGIAPAVSDTDE